MTQESMSKEFLDKAWLDAFEIQKARQIEATGLETASWRSGGRATKANPDKENDVWWIDSGREMLDKWVAWRTGSHGWKLWEHDGIPAIELGLNPVLGGVTVQMHIDRVMVTPDGELVILDLKTGQRTPSSDLQLAFYAVGLEKMLGIRPKYGTYWMARDGNTSPLVELDFYKTEIIEEMVADFDKARKAHLFIPNLNHCKMCDLTDKCKWYNKREK